MLKLLPISIILLLYPISDVIYATYPRPIVQTDKGKVEGYSEHTFGTKIDKFLGIPFARPPIGDLRFKPPMPMEPWEGVFDASHLPNSCMQLKDTTFGDFFGTTMWNANTEISEDCLYLSVWVPKKNPPFKNKAVMVFIYGGSFLSGSHTLDIYNTNHLVVENDIIYVAMQYRTGSLGFLTMDTPEALGNAGLWDQRMALEWISRNIQQFGGDPNRITLVSESAGSTSVGFHLLNDDSSNLFHRAILQSGAPEISFGALSKQIMWGRSVELANKLGCYKEGDYNHTIRCMRGKDARYLLYNEYVTDGMTQFPFVPVVDGVFLKEDPKDLIRRGKFKKVPLLLGSNANEISFFLIYHHSIFNITSQKLEISKEEYLKLLPSLFEYYPQYPDKLNKFGHDAIHYRYTNWLNSEDKIAFRESLDRAASDAYFVCPVNRLARAYSRHQLPVYYYWFEQRWTDNPWPEWMGVLHGDEIWFTFGQALNNSFSFTPEEKELSRKMMRFWSNFAETGNPNQAPGEKATYEWPRFYANEQKYIKLSTESMASNQTWSQGQGPRAQECAFWDYYLPKLISETAEATKAREEELQTWKRQYVLEWRTKFDEFLENYQHNASSKKCNSEK